MKISSAMPYFYDMYEEECKLFLPKPILYTKNRQKSILKTENKSLKKVLKEIEFIQVANLEDYINDIKNNNTEKISVYSNKMIEKVMNIKVNMEEEISNPYNIVSNTYMNKLNNDGIELEGVSGLYFIVYYKEQKQHEFIENIIKSLQYTGIGGKRSIGYGQFSIDTKADNSSDEDILYKLINKSNDSKYKMLISLLSPKLDEIEQIDNENIFYSLIKRSGFEYSNKNLKKKDIYMFEEGSCLDKLYLGDIKDVSKNDKHSVYKYGIGMYLGVDF